MKWLDDLICKHLDVRMNALNESLHKWQTSWISQNNQWKEDYQARQNELNEYYKSQVTSMKEVFVTMERNSASHSSDMAESMGRIAIALERLVNREPR